MKAVALALALMAVAGTAQAATCSAGSGKQEVTFELIQGSPDAVIEKGCFSGNDTNTIDANWTFNNISGWMLGDKTDDSSAYGNVDFGLFTQAPDYAWSVLNPMGYESVMVTLKQGKYFAAFLLDTTKALSGTWFTAGPGNSKGDISHASVYYAGQPNPAPIPLPAGAALLPIGLGALAMLRRRKAR